MSFALPEPLLTSHPVDVGYRTEAAIMAALVKRGHRVLLPFGVNQRYDLVIECEGRFLRAQCKTGRLRNEAVQFSAQSIQSNTWRTQTRSYEGEVELFIVHCTENDCIYVIPADEVPRCGMYLRLDPPPNRQCKGIRWVKDYELPA
jgi:PD-(D/E)XK nuclease superfamily protein